jgi:ribosome biogenesis protein YTM1
MSYNSQISLIATGHSDNAIRLWDPRVNQVTKSLKSHKGWVSSVTWLRNTLSSGTSSRMTTEYLLLSGSYDNSVKVWDIRSNIPLHSLQNHSDKVLSTSYLLNQDSMFIVSGGADCKLEVFSWSK